MPLARPRPMQTLSTNSSKNVTKNFRPREVISKKRIAYQELTGSETNYNHRTAAKILKIPRTTFQYWSSWNYQTDEADSFFNSPIGLTMLHQITAAAYFVISYRNDGIRGLQEFIRLSGLQKWMAFSIGAAHDFASRFEEQIVSFGKEQQKKLAEGMSCKKIVLGEDETFHLGKPCLVAIEVISNYILVEQYSEQRRAEDWNQAVNEALKGLNVNLLSSTTDGGTALAAHVKQELKIEQAPDLFHVQQDLSRATARPLKAQEREMEGNLEKEQKNLGRVIEKKGKDSEEAKEAQNTRDLRAYGYEQRKKRREDVKASIKAIGQDYHPTDLETGELQSAEKVKDKLEKHISNVEVLAKDANLGSGCIKKISKAKDQIKPLVEYLIYFLFLLKQFIAELNLTFENEQFFKEVIFPLAYLELVLKKTPTKNRKAIESTIEKLRAKTRAGPLNETELIELEKKAKEVACWFQRSSSCVEGRNGVLGMKHHGSHRLSQRRLNALTIVHNFHIRRPDGTTAAMRFFQKNHHELFETVLERTKMMGKPRKRKINDQALAS